VLEWSNAAAASEMSILEQNELQYAPYPLLIHD